MPSKGNNVISVSSVGPSKRKADFSNCGYGKIDVGHPAGGSATRAGRRRTQWRHPEPDPCCISEERRRGVRRPEPGRHAEQPVRRPRLQGLDMRVLPVDPGHVDGVAACRGVAALIVSEYGNKRHGGISLHPLFTQAYLEASATDTPCQSNQPDGTFSSRREPAGLVHDLLPGHAGLQRRLRARNRGRAQGSADRQGHRPLAFVAE